ncbi:hypothetical protein HYS48_00180 [Candidatus Woesearchaeota archaeon]|nr:hypothetical protein [Candidatus Woesearchaeota archaeon]
MAENEKRRGDYRNRVLQGIVCCIALLLLSLPAWAIGISPGSMVIDFQPGKTVDIQFKAINTIPAKNTFSVSANSPRMQCQPSTMELEPESEQPFTCTLQFPSIADQPPGVQEVGRVRLSEIAPAGAGIAAVAAVQSIVRVNYPYEGKYLQIAVIAQNVERGGTLEFVVQLNNLGAEPIEQAQVIIELFNPKGEKVGSIEQLPPVSLALKEVKDVPATFPTGSLPMGNYKAVATVTYDGKTGTGEAEFKIGDVYVQLKDVIAEKGRRGGNPKLNVDLESFWNQEIEYTITVEVSNNGNRIDQITTEPGKIRPWEAKRVDVFWESKDTPVGIYDVKVILRYAGKSEELFKENVIEIVGETGEGRISMLPFVVLGAIIVLLGLVIVVILLWKRRGKKGEAGKGEKTAEKGRSESKKEE